MLEHIHAPEGIFEEVTQQDADGPPVHANEDRFLILALHDVINGWLHPVDNVIGTFTTLDPQGGVAGLPLLKHVMVVGILLWRNPMTLLGSPTDLVQTDERGMRNSAVDKILNGLLAPLQRRGVYPVKRNILVGVKECARLPSSKIVQVGVHPASLDNILQVEIGLTMPYKVNFFDDQFLSYFGAASRPMKGLDKAAQK